MGKAVDLLLRIKGEASSAVRAGRQVEGANAGMSRSMRTVQTAGRAAGRTLAIGLGGAAVAALAFSKNAALDQAESRKLAIALRNTAHATDGQIASVERWITAQGKQLGFSDDQLRPALNRLSTATHNVGQAQKLASLAMDISAGTGKSLEVVSLALAKAQNGNVSSLGRLGLKVKDNHGKVKSLDRVTRDLAKTYRGQASAAANSAEGKFNRLRIRWDEATEAIGAHLIPAVTKLVIIGTGAIDWATNNGRAVKILAGSVLGLVAGVFLISKAITAWNTVVRVAVALQAVYNAVLAANPITLVVIAIIALVAGLILAYKHSARFRAIVQAVGRVGQRALGWVVSKTAELVGWVRDKVPAAFNAAKPVIVTAIKIYTFPLRTMIGVIIKVVQFIGRIPAAFESAKNKAIEIGDKLLAPFRAVRDMIQSIIDKISKIHLPKLPHVDVNPFNRVSASGFPQLAAPGFGGVVVNIKVTGTMLDPDGVAKAVEKVTARRFRRLGG